ncbi:MAG: hypothetical protein V4617_01380 [Gemmatimonadota bacterium]
MIRMNRLALLTMGAVALSACGSDSPTNGNVKSPGTVSISLDNSSGTALSLAPRSATLMQGFGILLQARVLDANGQPIASARPTWRSTNTAVFTVGALPDSGLLIDNNRAAVAAVGQGTALAIATYENLADTTTITVVPRTGGNGGGGTPPPPRAQQFDLTLRVVGLVVTTASTPGDSGTRTLQALPGSSVTLTLLPSTQGDSVATGVTPVTTPTVFGTATTDANGVARFTAVPAMRYRIAVQAPAASGWISQTQDASPPYWGAITREVMLRK